MGTAQCAGMVCLSLLWAAWLLAAPQVSELRGDVASGSSGAWSLPMLTCPALTWLCKERLCTLEPDLH